MDYKQALIDLIAYCQHNGALNSDSSVIGELADILDCHCYEIADLLES